MFEMPPSYALKSRRAKHCVLSRATSDPDVDRQSRLAIELAVSRVFSVEEGALWRETRGLQTAASARQVAMYLAHVSGGLSLTEVGRLFGRDRTTVAHACSKVETRRDDPLFDRALDLLGWALPTIARRPAKYISRH
jgi:chromosomal replication initiation ATPase DnaA